MVYEDPALGAVRKDDGSRAVHSMLEVGTDAAGGNGRREVVTFACGGV